MNKKTIIITLTAIVGVLCAVCTFIVIYRSWETRSLCVKSLSILSIIGWGYIIYDIVTLKFKWIKN